ncbi:MAG: hypothetical protein ABW124_20345 [Candidatus Thiodiazotropha sp. 6PLUC9]
MEVIARTKERFPANPLDDLQFKGLQQAIQSLNSEQLAWASGYLAGLVALQPMGNEAANESPALTILYATQGGKGPGRYNLQLGGDGKGLRLNRLFRKNLTENELLKIIDELFHLYAEKKLTDEGFGDFSVRYGLVKPVINPAEDYHDTP